MRQIARLNAGHVFARAGINAYRVAFVHEHRDLQGVAGLEGRGLGGVGGGVADDGGLADGDLELDEVGGLDGEGSALEELHGDVHILFDEVERVLDLAVVQGDLLIGVDVHEVVELAVVVEIFHRLGLDVGEVEFFGGVEGLFENAAGDDVLHLGADESRALAGLDVLEIHHGHDVVLVEERDSLAEVACHDLCHKFISCP